MGLKVSKKQVNYSVKGNYKRIDNKDLLKPDSVFPVGKHKGRLVSELLESEPELLIILSRYSKFFTVEETLLRNAWQRVDVSNFVPAKNIFEQIIK